MSTKFSMRTLFREDATADDLIDVIEGPGRKYCKCLYVYNKVDLLSLAEADAIARRPNSVVISSVQGWGFDTLMERLWAALSLVRVYTRKKGMFPDFVEPLVITPQRGDPTVETAVRMLHKDLLKDF
eukprot:Selendium_serpulae@DN4135_c1_g1_i3.p2